MDLTVLYRPAQLEAARLMREGADPSEATRKAGISYAQLGWALRETAFKIAAGYPVAPLPQRWYTTGDGRVWCEDCHTSPVGSHLPDCRMAA